MIGWIAAAAAAGLASAPPEKTEHLLLCGGAEVFALDVRAAAAGRIEKLWTWRGRDRDDLPEAVRGRFGTTDDCRPLDGGARVLISSSGGAVALVERPSGNVLWYARVPNAHGVERLPRNRIIAASSLSASGNKLMLFDQDKPDAPVWETPLHSAHGVVWDPKRERLWALGFRELRCYRLQDWDTDKPSLKLEQSLPLPTDDGHDLSDVPGTADLIVTTAATAYLFDRDKKEFRPHPELAGREHIKGVSIHPTTGRLAFTQAGPKQWWTPTLRLQGPAAEISLPGERLYRVRWLP